MDTDNCPAALELYGYFFDHAMEADENSYGVAYPTAL
jgi:hypothetical protein